MFWFFAGISFLLPQHGRSREFSIYQTSKAEEESHRLTMPKEEKKDLAVDESGIHSAVCTQNDTEIFTKLRIITVFKRQNCF